MSRQDLGLDVERLRAFGDAVFAIAITLLALDMKVPEGLSADEVGDAINDALGSVGGFLLSFLVIGILWISYHGLLGMAAELDRTLLYLDMALLAVVAGLPFPTKLLSDYGSTAVATSVYAASIGLASLLLGAMALRLLRPGMRKPDVSRRKIELSVWQSVVIVSVFLTSVPIALLSPSAAKYWWILAGPLQALVRRVKAEPVPAEHADPSAAK
ncbi:TMEM175 family protein [Streptomyces sp. NBC_00370]|uniref:TMEM175 family protein n=1 Tax=Streptomyces sp. NBC_00370 TaxID=2975728 RepID=UPI002E2590FA